MFSGDFSYDKFKNLGPLFFNIEQQSNENKILIYCSNLRKYFKQGKEESFNYLDMYSDVIFNVDSNISQAIELGNSKLFFRFVGDMNNFNTPISKSWNVVIEYPYSFNFLDFFKHLEQNYIIIEEMFSFRKSESNSNYSNFWYKHYNPVYRFAGLLLSYVEKVNMLWAQHESQM